MSNEVIAQVRAKYPSYENVEDDALTLAIAKKYPVYLENKSFSNDYARLSEKRIPRFDPSRPFELVSTPKFDPTKPFTLVEPKSNGVVQVDIPAVGVVNFPESMSMDDINKESERLYSNASKRTPPTPSTIDRPPTWDETTPVLTAGDKPAAAQPKELSDAEVFGTPPVADELGIGEEVRGVARSVVRGGRRFAQQADVSAMRRPAQIEDELKSANDRLQQSEAFFSNETFPSANFNETDKAVYRQGMNRQRAEAAHAIATLTNEREQLTKRLPSIAADFVHQQAEIEKLPLTEAQAEFQKEETPWWKFFSNPVELAATTTAESLPSMVTGLTGAPFGPAGLAATMGASSFGAESSARVMNAMQTQGVDLKNPDAVLTWFSDRSKADPATAKADLAAMGPAAFDALTAGVAGRWLKGAVGKGAGKVAVATGKEIGVQMAGGGVGSIAGSALAGEKVDWKDVVLEMAAELAPVEAISNLRTERQARVAEANRLPATAEALRSSSLFRPIEPVVEGTPGSPLAQPIGAQELLGREEVQEQEEVPLAEQDTGATVAPVPETLEAVAKQFELTLDPASTKAVTLVTPGSPMPVIPEGLEVVPVGVHGTAIFNPTQTTRDAVIEAGKRKDFDGTLLGFSKSAKPEPVGNTVVHTTVDDIPVLDEVVENRPDAIALAMESHHKATNGRGQSSVVPAEKVLGERKALTGKALSNVPGGTIDKTRASAQPATAGATITGANEGRASGMPAEPGSSQEPPGPQQISPEELERQNNLSSAETELERLRAAGKGQSNAAFHLRARIGKLKLPLKPKPQPRKKATPAAATERAPDIISDIEDHFRTGSLSLVSAREHVEGYRPSFAARRLFSKRGGGANKMDSVLDTLHRVGLHRSIQTEGQLIEAIEAAAQGRQKAKAKGQSEKHILAEEEKQTVEFEKAQNASPPRNPETIDTSTLIEGDQFTIKGETVTVQQVEIGEDGDATFVVLDDGRRFGTQTVSANKPLNIDKGSLKEATRPKDFVPDELLGKETPFNLAGEKLVPTEEAAPSPSEFGGFGDESLAQSEMFAIQQIVEHKDPAKSADAAERLYGAPLMAARKVEEQLAVVDADVDTRKAFSKEQRTRLKEVIALLRQRAANAEGTPLESRIAGKEVKASVFEMDEGDLADLFAERFGDTESSQSPLSSGRAGAFNFPSYAAFRDWMDARYGERDVEGMKLAFAEAPTPNKIRYIKENIGADAHKKAWLTHLATGAVLPAASPPVARTTPRPTPSGAPPTAGATPPARPGQPPPPPRAPTHQRKFDITALVQLFRLFSKFPTVNDRLMRAYGRFVPGTNAVELKARLLWDTALAERVLGHEIGHFIDLAVEALGKGKQFGMRLVPLWDLRRQVWTKTELKNEARDLSRQWRGNFVNGDRYRDSAAELFADTLSAMFNQPEMVNQKFPKLFEAFKQTREGKPQFDSAYREIETWLQGGTMVNELRAQDSAAVHRTFDELLNQTKPSTASLMDRLKFGTVSLWGRAFEKEGKPRFLGQSLTDELEYSSMWAATQNALFVDDYAKSVTPELAKVSDDPIQGRADLLSYSKAVRTIGERRAAGLWIENNPVESRQMLHKVLSLDAGLRSKFGGDLSRATDVQLYDLAAAIFREVHDRGEAYVGRIEREIDRLDLGVDGEAALMAFNVRGKLLNPGGLTVENAEKMLVHLEDTLGATKFRALETAAKNLRDLLYDVQSKMHDEGLIFDKTWQELIEPNKDNYLPYAVLDYFDGKVRAGMMQQKGTAKDIADIAAATQLKIAASNVWRQKQRQVQLVRDVYAKGGAPADVGEVLKRARDIKDVRAKNLNDDVSRAVLWVDGRPHVIEFPGDQGKLLEAAMENPAFYEHIGWIADASDMTHKVMQFYTQFSVPFLLWRNPIRGARTAGLKVGFGKVAQQMSPAELKENLALAKNYAEAAFGGEMLPEVRDLVERQILMPPRLSQAMVRDSANLRDLLMNHTILANQVRGLDVDAAPRWWKGGKLGREGVVLSEKVFTAYEAFEKIYNYQAAIEKGMTEEQAGAIARRAGIPKPGVGGKWSLAMEVWFPWTRVHIQGMRASYDMLRDPELGKAFAARFALTEALPRVAKVAIATGVVAGAIRWALGDDEDKDDGVMAEFLRRVSPYKMALDDTVPLYFYDARTGKVHYLWEFKNGKSIPKHFEAVSLRIPASEEGRLWGTLLYNAMISAPDVDDKLGKPGETFVSNMGNWAFNYALPGLSPIIETGSNLKDMVLLGKNPKDAYRNQPSANQKLFDAGGVERAQAIAGYVMNQGGSVGELAGVMAANFGLLDERALNALSGRLPTDYRQWNQKVPFLKTAIAHDNYGQYREEQIPKLEEQQIRAKARLLMSNEVRGLYDFYYRNLNRQEKLTESEKRQFAVSKRFVEKVWGNLTVKGKPNSHSFYSKAAHAVGADGSREARKTLSRDLEAAAAPHIAAFKKYRGETQ